MRRSNKKWLGLFLVLVGMLLALVVLRRSESERIVDELKSLAAALEFDRLPLETTWVTHLRTRLDASVANPVSIAIAPDEESAWDPDTLVQGIVNFASSHNGLRIRLNDIGVRIDPNGVRASVKGEAFLEIVDSSAVRRGEPRKFAATLVKGPNGWMTVHAQISEPRIDQPEARP